MMIKLGKISKEGILRIESVLMTIMSDIDLSDEYVRDPKKVLDQFDSLTMDEKALLETRKRVALEEAGVNMRQFLTANGSYLASVTRDNGNKITPDTAMSIPNKAKLFEKSAQ